MNSSEETSCVHFLLTSEALIACNRGRPFSNGGLDAICTSNRSNKTDVPLESPEGARAAVTKLSDVATGLYLTEAGPTLLEEQCNAEKGVSRDYGARILLELLQNADDAMGADPIGYKGLGFKCILNLTETPRLHSGPLSVQFGRDLSADHLAEKGLQVSYDSLPVLRIPFWCETPESDLITGLRNNYDTVLILPFLSEEARCRVLREWIEIVEDPSILVFLQNITSVHWEDKGTVREWSCRREESRVIVSGGAPGALIDTTWKVARGKTALGAAAIPVSDHFGDLLSMLETPHLRAFFPIHKEHSPFPRLLIHGQFPLNQSREYVLGEPEELRPVVVEIAEAVRTLLGECASFGRVLDLLNPRIAPNQMDGLERKLWEQIRNRVVTLTIPGEPPKTIESVRILPNRYLQPENRWEDSAEALNRIKISTKRWLDKVRPEGLADLPFLNEDWEKPKRESTLVGLVDSCLLDGKRFQALPLFPVGEGPGCVSPSEYFVAVPPKDGFPPAPEAIRLRGLSTEGYKNLTTGKQVHEYLQKVGGLRKFEIESIIEEAVIPDIPEVGSPQLLRFLFDLTRGSTILTKPFDWFSLWRAELARRLRVPFLNGQCRPPKEVYAGHDWTGDCYLEDVFSHRADRAFLPPPPDDSEERKALETFYQWLGVGFSPKVVPVPGLPSLEKPKAEMRVGARWANGQFILESPPNEWDSYCHWLRSRATSRSKLATHSARLRQNWMLDCDLSELERPGGWSAVVNNWDYYANFLKAVWFQSKNKKEDNDNERVEGESFLFWTFISRCWVPTASGSGLHALTEVFLKGPISELLKEWAPEVAGETPEGLAKEFQIPRVWADLNDDRWVRWLKRLESSDPSSIPVRNTIQLVYRAFLNNVRGESGERFSACPVWAIKRDWLIEGEWTCVDGTQRQTVFYVDRPDLDELPTPGVVLFSVRLGEFSGKAKRLLGIEPLSENIAFKIAPDTSLQPENIVRVRVREKLGLLSVASAGGGSDDTLRNNLRENFSSLQILVTDDLWVTGYLRGEQLTEEPIRFPFLHEPDERRLLLSKTFALDGDVITERAWVQVAAALLMGPNIPESVAKTLHLLEKLLRLESEKDIEDCLRSTGLSMDDVEQFRMETEAFVDSRADEMPGTVTAPSMVEGTVEQAQNVRMAGVSKRSGIPQVREVQASGGGKASQKERTRQGLEAQEWLRSQLADFLHPQGWATSPTVIKDNERRESDIVLKHPDGQEIHLEVKRRNGVEIFWSKLEIEKATLHKDRYWMAILVPQTDNNEEPYRVHWIFFPLESLDECDKFCRWNWTHFDEPFIEPGWQLPTTEEMRGPDRFSFRILVEDDWLHPYRSSVKGIAKGLKGFGG